MKIKAFTLIEVMVVMAIISILAGMLVPSVWKFWEGEDIIKTKARMRDIKNGLVGNKNLLQNGVRTHYGFVGDNGELPTFSAPTFTNRSSSASELTYLVNRPPTDYYPNWNGPYLSGFESDWYNDAWRTPFRFRYFPASVDYHGRYISAELRSAGPDGIFDNSDDIVDADIQISDREVTPTNQLQGNINDIYGNYSSLNIILKFKDPLDVSGISIKSICKTLSARPGYTNYTTALLDENTDPLKLPIGEIEVNTTLHNRQDCGDASIKATNSLLYFLSDNANKIILPELR